MESHSHSKSVPEASVLVVADWEADPHSVLAACARRQQAQPSSFVLLVPALLHGLDWVGDPYASVPCAKRALAEISRLCQAAGLTVRSARVGDPDPVAAIDDVLACEPVDRILVCTRNRPLLDSHPLDLAHRARRVTRLPVLRARTANTRSTRRGRGRKLLGEGHCAASSADGLGGSLPSGA